MTATKARSVSLKEEAEAQKTLEEYQRAEKTLRETLASMIANPDTCTPSNISRVDDELTAIGRKVAYWRGVVEAYEQHFYNTDERQ